MDIRSKKTRKIVEKLQKQEKKGSDLRDAIKRSNANLDASQNALRVVEQATAFWRLCLRCFVTAQARPKLFASRLTTSKIISTNQRNRAISPNPLRPK